ncbi:MAG: KH domain-containing protein [Clostridiales bacterium]|nr:KH domain-containing protein [Clostridiales bacterium]
MKELLLYMAKSLVDNPDQVEVNEIDGDVTVLELRVAPEDMGKLIGRQGRIAKEIRTIIKSVAQRNGKKVSVEILD